MRPLLPALPPLFLGALSGLLLSAQQPVHRQKVLTPQQIAYQQQFAAYLAQRNTLGKEAQAALAAEEALPAEDAKTPNNPCIDAESTRSIEQCQGKLSDSANANLAQLRQVLRSVLALSPPDLGVAPGPGPEGMALTPEQQVAEFDGLEKQWGNYRKQADSAAFDRYKGGTLAPVFAQEMDLHLTRSHMQELRTLYGNEIFPH